MLTTDLKAAVRDRRSLSDNLIEKISVSHLNFFYGTSQALRDVSVSIWAQRVTALIGPSGCGKSTLLRVFNRMYELYPGHRAEGSVRLDGEDILAKHHDLNGLRSRVGMLFQKPTPFPMSIFDNVAMGIRIYESLSRAELRARVELALRRAALWDEVKDRLKKNAFGLSGGQQQRLCIARTIATQPEVILLDEPCASLDPISTAKIEETMDELKKDHTIIIVTHNLQQAGRVSDFCAFMYLGELVEFGSCQNCCFPLRVDPAFPLRTDPPVMYFSDQVRWSSSCFSPSWFWHGVRSYF